MSAEKIIKSQAREKLKHGGWPKALFALALVVIAYMVIECIDTLLQTVYQMINPDETMQYVVQTVLGFVLVISVFLFCPVVMGFFRMFYTDENNYNISDVLYYFSSFKKYILALKYQLMLYVRLLLAAVVFYILPAVLYVTLRYLSDNGELDIGGTIAVVLLTVSSTILLLIYNIRYYVSLFLLCENENEDTAYYFKTSKEIMRGHETDVMKLFLSFIWWILLSITGLPALYTIPYIAQSVCLSGKWLTQLSRNGQTI